MASCSQPQCSEQPECMVFFSLTPSHVPDGDVAHLLLPSGRRFCQAHKPQDGFWSLVNERDWEQLCQTLEEYGIARPIRDMAELVFVRIPWR